MKNEMSNLSIRDVAAGLGISLPAKDGNKFTSPFRRDKNPSCWVFNNRLYDGSSGESWDAVAFYATATGLTNAEAFKKLVGTGRTFAKKPAAKAITKPVTWPEPIRSSRDEMQTLADVRKLKPEAVEYAACFAKTLSFANVFGFSCWVLSDRARIGWEARRLDGQKFPAMGNLTERKSHARGQGLKSWPVGILPPGFSDEQIQAMNPTILLVEGGPDYIAACQLTIRHPEWNILPAAMLGKAADICSKALPLFAGRKVSIAGHPDAEPRVARWATQIKAARASQVRPVLLESGDLNDVLSNSPATETELFTLLNL